MTAPRFLGIGLAAALLALAAQGPARAADDAGDCADVDGGQSDLNECAGREFHAADAELNRVYKQLMAMIVPEAKTRLRDAQKAWIDFRDKECKSRTGGWETGSIYPLYFAGCLTELTVKRVKDLKEQLDCDETDPECLPRRR